MIAGQVKCLIYIQTGQKRLAFHCGMAWDDDFFLHTIIINIGWLGDQYQDLLAEAADNMH